MTAYLTHSSAHEVTHLVCPDPSTAAQEVSCFTAVAHGGDTVIHLAIPLWVHMKMHIFPSSISLPTLKPLLLCVLDV